MKFRNRLSVNSLQVLLAFYCALTTTVFCQEPAPLPVITLTVKDAEAVEPLPIMSFIKSASFLVQRTGSTKTSLEVQYAVEGSAKNSVDYRQLSGAVTIPAGQSEAFIYVQPYPDNLIEGDESVIVTLKPGVDYQLGNSITGKAIIHSDNTNPPTASIKITSPVSGAKFTAPFNINIEATAVDKLGYIPKVEFYDNANKIGESEIFFIRAPDPGTPIEHHFLWKNVPIGAHRITARAFDSQGKIVESEPVEITVTSSSPDNKDGLFARDLPENYVPGETFKANIRVFLPQGTSIGAYAVEEQPPQDWKPAVINNEGVYDAMTGKIKWGPYFDQVNRNFTYTLIPPRGSSGVKEFSGFVSVNGKNYPIGGSLKTGSSLPKTHPADNQPADQVLALDEVSGYGAAWKLGKSWPIAPNPIPANYVTRATMLWRSGEKYRLDSTAGSPPLCWVPLNNVKITGMAINLEANLSTQQGRRAERMFMPMNATRKTVQVKLQVKPPSDSLSYAVQEQIPSSWKILSTDNDGYIDQQNHQVRWGPFLNALPRMLTYYVLVGSETTGTFEGIVSIDGLDQAILGRQTYDSNLPPKVAGIKYAKPLPGNRVQISFDGNLEPSSSIEASSDLSHWTTISQAPTEGEISSYTDPESSTSQYRFYRIRY